MEAKIKAQQLVMCFWKCGEFKMPIECAKITVDEILKDLECAYNVEPITTNERKKLYREVKQHLNEM